MVCFKGVFQYCNEEKSKVVDQDLEDWEQMLEGGVESVLFQFGCRFINKLEMPGKTRHFLLTYL